MTLEAGSRECGIYRTIQFLLSLNAVGYFSCNTKYGIVDFVLSNIESGTNIMNHPEFSLFLFMPILGKLNRYTKHRLNYAETNRLIRLIRFYRLERH